MTTRARSTTGMRVFYFVHPEFHKHAHIHALKVRCLRDLGVRAEVCSVVSLRQISRRPQDYGDHARRLGVRVLRVPHRMLAAFRTTLFLARLLYESDVTAQILRCPWPYTGWLRRHAARRGRQFRCLLELEGDPEAEADYLSRHPYRDGFYAPTIAANRRWASRVSGEVADADGLVLMSDAHARLWEERLGRPVRAVAMPALFDSRAMRFDAAARAGLRRTLGIEDRIVLLYSGNVLWSWQRFGSACRLLAQLARSGVPVFLLALVHEAEHSIAQDFIHQHAVEGVSKLLSSPAAQVHEFLSAADFGLFLRDDHLMNRIVTSAKLGEYLACGLPVITTGNAALYHDFIRAEGIGVFLSDPERCLPQQVVEIQRLAALASQVSWRATLSQRAHERFAATRDRSQDYLRLVTGSHDPGEPASGGGCPAEPHR